MLSPMRSGKQVPWRTMRSSGSDMNQAVVKVASFLLLFVLLTCAAYSAITRSHANALLMRRKFTNGTLYSDGGEFTKFDSKINLVRLNFATTFDPRQNMKGWLLDPLAVAKQEGLTGGSTSCKSVHIGQILPLKFRGNHRHHFCNETILLWGAKQKVRMESPESEKGYYESILREDEVAIFAGPVGLAHAIFNLDESRTSYLLACQDEEFDPKNPLTDYNVWKESSH